MFARTRTFHAVHCMKKLRVTVNGTSYDVDVEILEDDDHPGYGYATTAQYSNPVAPVAPVVSAPVMSAPAHAPTPASKPKHGDSKTLTSPIPGTVIEIKVAIGDAVKENQPLVIVEAMKMNTPICSQVAGKIKEIKVKPGEPVQQDQVLLTFE